MKSIFDLKKKKFSGEKITMVTCYDHWSAKVLGKTEIDCLLIGDSLAMVAHGFDSTVHATIEMMELHTAAVARAKTGKLIVSDLPFLAHRKDNLHLMNNVDRLMKAGAEVLKVEMAPGQENIVSYISQSGVPVIGHIGLTPQYVHQLGGYKVQGKSEEAAKILLQQANDLQGAGAHALVLECVPSSLAQEITTKVDIPTIGIGAGSQVDGQVLVLQDLLGFDDQFQPRFVRHFANGQKWMTEAVKNYSTSVHNQEFPKPEESFQ